MSKGDKWEFIEGDSYFWRITRATGRTSVSKAFNALHSAMADAVARGFNPTSDYWTVTMTNGLTTHYRPGRTPINMPTGEAPPE